MASEDDKLLKRAEQALSEIDRTTGLIDEHADVLASLRIRIYGAPKKSLDEVLKAAGELKGKRRLEELDVPKPKRSLDDALKLPEKKKDWPAG